MVILVDMDDVIDDLLPAWLCELNRKFARQVTTEEILDWDLTKAYPHLTKKELHQPLLTYEFWDTVKPIDGAAEALRQFIDDGHAVYIVTNSHYKTLAGKMELVLFRYFPFLTWDNVIITSHKQMVRGDVLIDDYPLNLIGGDYEKIVIDAPYNRDFDTDSCGAYRAYNWGDVKRFIKKIEGKVKAENDNGKYY